VLAIGARQTVERSFRKPFLILRGLPALSIHFEGRKPRLFLALCNAEEQYSLCRAGASMVPDGWRVVNGPATPRGDSIGYIETILDEIYAAERDGPLPGDVGVAGEAKWGGGGGGGGVSQREEAASVSKSRGRWHRGPGRRTNLGVVEADVRQCPGISDARPMQSAERGSGADGARGKNKRWGDAGQGRALRCRRAPPGQGCARVAAGARGVGEGHGCQWWGRDPDRNGGGFPSQILIAVFAGLILVEPAGARAGRLARRINQPAGWLGGDGSGGLLLGPFPPASARLWPQGRNAFCFPPTVDRKGLDKGAAPLGPRRSSSSCWAGGGCAPNAIRGAKGKCSLRQWGVALVAWGCSWARRAWENRCRHRGDLFAGYRIRTPGSSDDCCSSGLDIGGGGRRWACAGEEDSRRSA